MTRTELIRAVLADIAAKLGTYAEIGARYGLTKGQVSRIVQNSRGTRYRERPSRRVSTLGHAGGGDWESRLFEPYSAFKARRAQERARA